jgi:hypothetical protein
LSRGKMEKMGLRVVEKVISKGLFKNVQIAAS